jgi:hypothetical protein
VLNILLTISAKWYKNLHYEHLSVQKSPYN